MTTVLVGPGTLEGTVRAPPSKSYTHRAIVAAHLAGGKCVVRGPLVADDTLRTARAVRSLGSSVTLEPGRWTIRPGPGRPRRLRSIDCGESGTTLRFASALASLGSSPYRLVGSGRLPVRPMGPLLRALRSLGAEVTEPRDGRSLPLAVRGPIHGGPVDLDPSVSSQFTSALLFVLPVVRPDSRVVLRGRAVSEPYVAATLALLRARGVKVRPTRHGYSVPGGQRYAAGSWTVPGDASSAAYLWAGAAISRGSVEVDGIPETWPQADLAILGLLRRYGASVRRAGERVRVTGRDRRPFRCDLDPCPDLYPLAGVLAAAAPGTSVLEGGTHAAAKESDRRIETARLARSLGAKVRLSERTLSIRGTREPRALRYDSSHDHRVVMSAAVGALAAGGPSRLGDVASVSKSFPEFFDVWKRLGAEVAAA